MDKTEAIITVINDARSTKSSTASAKRVVKALNALGLSESERLSVMVYLDYCREDGSPYSDNVKRVW